MATFRIMSYHVNGFRTVTGEIDPQLSARIIRSQMPDLVMLQQIGSPIAASTLEDYSDLVGLAAYGPDDEGGCPFLSRYPLHNIQEFSLGHGGRCARADLDMEGERLHLFNLCLSFDPWQRREQIRTLLSDQLLNNQTLPCATIVSGDFTLPLWGYGQIRLSEHLRRARFPFWRANYPASFPLWGRDRIYFRGPVRALAGMVLTSGDARRASPHLPLLVTAQTCDTRTYLHLREKFKIRKADPVCG